jgi:hypothetical protein
MNAFTKVTVVAVVLCGGLSSPRWAAAITLEEAQQLSQQTGRPIFAVAGTET